jgi:hypothetical protein
MIFRKDLTGKRFGKLIALSFSHEDKHGNSHWNCICDCGTNTIKNSSYLNNGDTTSCGCKLIEHKKTFGNSRKGMPGSIKLRKTTEKFIEEATIKHNGKYTYLKTIYTGAHRKTIITCDDHGDFYQTPRNHLFGRGGKGQGCPKCGDIENANKTRTSNEEIDALLLINNPTIKRIGDHISQEDIEWGCLICDHKWLAAMRVANGKTGCAKCKNTRLTNEFVDNYLLVNNILIKRIGEYINALTKLLWSCLVCDHIWLAQPCEIMRKKYSKTSGKLVPFGSGCPNCARQKNEKLVGEILKKLDIKTAKLRINLPSKQKLFPDYHLPDLNIIIEYNGAQHYQPIQFGSMTKEDARIGFEDQLIRDELMREYCRNNNISLLEIDGRKYKGGLLREFIMDYFNEFGDKNE